MLFPWTMPGYRPGTGPLTDAQLRAAPLRALLSGVVMTTPLTTSVASSISSVLLLAANPQRRGLSISNSSSSTLHLSFHEPATLTNCFLALPPGAFLLLDQQCIVPNAVHGFWSAADGTAQVTEYV